MICEFNGLGYGIDSLDGLKKHLLVAIKVEHAVIPPYLCALFSLQGSRNELAAYVLHSIVVEEMLHVTLATNVLNAIGGEPEFDRENFLPGYPTSVPHHEGPLTLRLLRFSRAMLDMGLALEQPEAPGALPQAGRYTTLAQFYAAIEDGLAKICPDDSDYAHKPERQVGPEHYYGSGGKAIRVTSLATALGALQTICQQGEGARGTIRDGDRGQFGDGQEVAHYYRFVELVNERFYGPGDSPYSAPAGPALPIDWDSILPMRADPAAEQFPKGTELRQQMDEFNRGYTDFLQLLQQAFTGQPALLQHGVGRMYSLKVRALELMRNPCGNGETAGPSFQCPKTVVTPTKRRHRKADGAPVRLRL